MGLMREDIQSRLLLKFSGILFSALENLLILMKSIYNRGAMNGLVILSLFLIVNVSLAWIPYSAEASSVNFRVDELQTTVWINEDGSIDLYYQVKVTCESGTLSSLTMYLPGREFILGEAVDDQGREIEISLGEDGTTPILTFTKPILEGASQRFNFTANVQNIILHEVGSTNETVLNFTPVTWNASVTMIQVLVVLPEGAEADNLTITPHFNRTQSEEESGRLVIVWEGSLKLDESFTLKISYSSKTQNGIEAMSSGWDAFVDQYLITNRSAILAASLLVLIVIPFNKEIRKRFSNRKLRRLT